MNEEKKTGNKYLDDGLVYHPRPTRYTAMDKREQQDQPQAPPQPGVVKTTAQALGREIAGDVSDYRRRRQELRDLRHQKKLAEIEADINAIRTGQTPPPKTYEVTDPPSKAAMVGNIIIGAIRLLMQRPPDEKRNPSPYQTIHTHNLLGPPPEDGYHGRDRDDIIDGEWK